MREAETQFYTPKPKSRDASAVASPLVKAERVAELLSCSIRGVWRLASTGDLPRVRVPHVGVRFRLADVERIIRQGGDE